MTVPQALDTVGCRYWLEGGWGVDALVGRETRPHRNVDVDFDAAYEAEALAVLQQMGYVVETDWRPNRVELVRRLHPRCRDRLFRRAVSGAPELGRAGLSQLIYFNEVNKGGHFAAWEEPQLFTEEVRAAFRSLPTTNGGRHE